MKTLNGTPIDPQALAAHAGAMFEVLERIANAANWEDSIDPAADMRDLARETLAPCHFFSFEVPTGGVANTDPEDMSAAAFQDWLSACPADRRHEWEQRRWTRAQARSYVQAMHNDAKRSYAAAYLEHLLGKRSDAPRVSTISAMAAQSVRLRLAEILRSDCPAQRKPAPVQEYLIPLSPFNQPCLI